MNTEPVTAAPQIHARLAAVLAGVEAIGKDRKSGQDGYGPKFSYRGVDDVYNELHGLFAKHRIYLSPEIVNFDQKERQTDKGKTQIHAVVTVRYTFTADDGSSTSMTMVGEAADSGDKSLGKACQYAIKVLLLQAFLIPTEGDNDPDARSVEWGQREQARPRQQQRDTKPGNFREQYGDLPKADRPAAEVKAPGTPYEQALDAIRRAPTEATVRRWLAGARTHENPEIRDRIGELEGLAAERIAALSAGGTGR